MYFCTDKYGLTDVVPGIKTHFKHRNRVEMEIFMGKCKCFLNRSLKCTISRYPATTYTMKEHFITLPYEERRASGINRIHAHGVQQPDTKTRICKVAHFLKRNNTEGKRESDYITEAPRSAQQQCTWLIDPSAESALWRTHAASDSKQESVKQVGSQMRERRSARNNRIINHPRVRFKLQKHVSDLVWSATPVFRCWLG